MNRFMTRAMFFILAIFVLSAPAVMAELERGDRGDDVAELQQLLFESGWLFELPDGIFGKNTEAAVKGFEEYANLPVDGIADNQMIYELSVALEALNEENGVVSGYYGENPSIYFGSKYMGIDYSYGDIDDSYEVGGGIDFAECCIQYTEVDGSSRTDYCEKHHNLHKDTYDMLAYGDLASACMASDMWREEVDKLYAAWASVMPEAERGAIMANRATFFVSVESQRTALQIGSQAEEQMINSEAGICQTLRNQAAWLCGMVWQQGNGGLALSNDDSRTPVVLNPSVIIDGNEIYYAGNLAGEGEGIYVMNADGSNRRRISDIQALLMAVSNDNLLVWHYDGKGDGALEVIRQDGTLETVSYSYSHCIAHDGRFYFGGSSVAEDGSDHQWLLSSDPEYHDNYYPVEVAGGYLYYLDLNGGVGIAYNEGGRLPSGDVELNRLNLATGDIELLSGAGTNYLGIEDGMLYYTREDFEVYDYESDGWFSVDVDDGLYSMNLEVLAETMLAEISDSDLIFEYYMFCQDGVVYAERSDYREDEAVYEIIRRQVNGEELPALQFGDNDILVLCAKDGVLYGLQGVFEEYSDSYTYSEYIVAYDLESGSIELFAIDANEAMSYTEARPRIAVENDRIYYYVQDESNGAESLKCMMLDGSGIRTLAKSAPLY